MPHYLIDGYNLLHAMGVLPRRVGPGGLQKGRLRLLGLLRASHSAGSADVTVVFDAAGAPPGAADAEDFDGIHIRYAIRVQQADDLIEEIISHDSAPKNLVVVSDDHRIQQAGRRRHCVVQGCAEYLEGMLRRRRAAHAPPPVNDDAKPSPSADRQRWLEEFADLERDPELKDFFERFDFEE